MRSRTLAVSISSLPVTEVLSITLSGFAFEEEKQLTGKIAGKWFEREFVEIDEFAVGLDAFADSIVLGSVTPCQPME